MTPIDDIYPALQCIPADDRKTWIQAGMAIKSELGDAGFSLWDDWSRTADNYEERAARDVWRSFKAGKINVGTLFYLAKSNGWREGSQPLKRIIKPRSAPTPIKRNTGAYGLELWLKSDWKSAPDHPYPQSKGITWPAGAGRVTASGRVIGKDADCLIVPIRDISTFKVKAVQCINPLGKKQTFGPASGNGFVCGNTLDLSLPWFVVEGWADAISMVFHHLDGNAVAFAALGKGNMDMLAKKIADIHAPDKIIIWEDAA